MIKIRNLKSFSVDVDKFADRLGLDVVTVVKKLSFDIFADVVAGTPVDTGRAMNNWNISVGVPNHKVRKAGGTAASVASGKQGEATTALATLAPFQTVWLSNSLPYIGFLEEGTSKQAPNGWVARAIQNNMQQLGRFGL